MWEGIETAFYSILSETELAFGAAYWQPVLYLIRCHNSYSYGVIAASGVQRTKQTPLVIGSGHETRKRGEGSRIIAAFFQFVFAFSSNPPAKVGPILPTGWNVEH